MKIEDRLDRDVDSLSVIGNRGHDDAIHAAVTTTIRLRLDGRSTVYHSSEINSHVTYQWPLTREPQ